jgi:NDP-sugar pyrophosphorylase family protein
MWENTERDYSRHVKKALILAAGRGKRMGKLTGKLPKPMLPVSGKPLLEHILDRLREAGFESVLIVTGYLAEKIESHFAKYPMRVEFVRQAVTNGTARAALLGREFAGQDPFLLTYGDILAEPEDYRGLVQLMSQPDVEAVIAVKHVPDPYQGAAVYERDGQVTRIVEKPPPGTSTTNWNSAGVYAFRPGIFDELAAVPLSERGEYELTSAITEMLAKGKRLLLYELRGEWRDVGRPEDLRAADEIT